MHDDVRTVGIEGFASKSPTKIDEMTDERIVSMDDKTLSLSMYTIPVIRIARIKQENTTEIHCELLE